VTTLRPLALTMGDPAGIGPEIAAITWGALRTGNQPFFWIGDGGVMRRACADLDLPAPRLIVTPDEAAAAFSQALPVLHHALPAPSAPGEPNPDNAPAVRAAIDAAVDLALSRKAGGVVTGPIAKSVMYQRGFTFPGHTEYLAELCGQAPMEPPRGPVMMLAGGGLRAALVTVHQPLKEALASITQERIVQTARVVDAALRRDFGIAAPRLALAGLNPHAGEAGALGREEIEQVNPAAQALRDTGVNITDALPPDTMFHAEARAGYDAAICLYHDQGLIPVKTLDFHGGVNVTLGLPIIRTSPDHGTAFDIAGQGRARPDSLIAAIRLAADMANQRARG